MDGLKFSEHPEARAELRNATIWYESKNDGLAARFPMPWETRCKTFFIGRDLSQS